MTNEEMEAILRRAGEDLPGPAKAAPHSPPVRAPRRRLVRTAALIAAVVLLTVTVFAATVEVPIPDASQYYQWVWHFGNQEKYDLELEPSYGAYVLQSEIETWVVPRGTTFLEAMFNATYRTLHADYRYPEDGSAAPGWGLIRVCAGKIDHPYWRAYFSFDLEDVPDALQDMTVQEYGGYTLYCGNHLSRSGSSTLYLKWVDYDRGFLYSISFHGAAEDRDLALEFAKHLIDTNR